MRIYYDIDGTDAAELTQALTRINITTKTINNSSNMIKSKCPEMKPPREKEGQRSFEENQIGNRELSSSDVVINIKILSGVVRCS